MGKKGKKGKKPQIYTEVEHLRPFGLSMRDIVTTPLGLQGTVIGVKYEDAEVQGTGRVWVEYTGGRQSPLEPRLSQGSIQSHGYTRNPDSDHLFRDVLFHKRRLKEAEELRQKAEEQRRLRREALALEGLKGKGGKGGAKRPATAA